MLTREQILEERKYYYSLTYVLFELVKNLHHKELCFLSQKGEIKKYATRYLLAFNIDYLKKHFERFAIGKSLINLYHSCAILKNVPVFSYNFKLRREADEYKEFNENYKNYVQNYDFFLDIDGKENFELAYSEAKEIKKILDEYHLPYYILNSSFTGFHICIESKYLPIYPIDELLKILNDVIYNFKGIYGFKTIDTSITDLKRVKKLPYSYVCDSSICLPLTDEMFLNFSKNKDMVSMKTVLKKIMIKNRGLLTRNMDKFSEEQLKKNVQKFISDFQ